MLQVARLAPRLLGESAELVGEFTLSRLDPGGGFCNRDGRPDLYYTVFGLGCLQALDAPLPEVQTERFLRGFDDGAGLDLVHLACLARAWAALPGTLDPPRRAALRARIEACRAAGGGFADLPGTAEGGAPGTVYGAFLGLAALEDLGVEDAMASGAADLAAFVAAAGGADGAYGAPATTPVAAAAVTLLRHLGQPVQPRAAEWLLARWHPQGGFAAAPGVPAPDLLSTATALHALAALEHPLDRLAEPALDFLDSLWTNRGAFHGHWADDDLDCEYTFYGLLALGHLSLWNR
jgi:hypothetical protein